MSEPRLISPMLDGFAMGDPISDHNGVRSCPAMRNDSDDRYIVKIISIPASQQRLEALLLTGAYSSAEAAKEYFYAQAQDVIKEYRILEHLSAQEGFIGFREYQIAEMENGEVGYDVYLLSDYRKTLQRHFATKPMTHLGAVNLGLDMCSALSACRRAGYIFTNLRPANIHLIDGGEYRISDLGFVSLDSLKYASLPDKYRSQYTAPEIADAFSSLNTTVDIYALGLILYQAYNGGSLPFTADSAPAEKLPAPEYADYEMAEIILKACDPDPEQRWQDPAQMGQALVSYMQRNGANDTPIVPPAIPLVEDTPEEETTKDEVSIIDNAAPNEELTTEVTENPALNTPQNELEEIMQEFAQVPTIDSPAIYSEDKDGNLSFLNIGEDETTQELTGEEVPYEEISQEVSEMMQQVDAIAEHPVPAPVVVPEEIEVPIPEPPVEAPAAQQEEVSAPTEGSLTSIKCDETGEMPISEEETAIDQPTEDSMDMADSADGEEDYYTEESKPKKKHTVRNIILALIVAGLVAAGFLFYKFYYIQSIDKLELSGKEDSLEVRITTDVSYSDLSVTCADAYGNKMTSPVINGVATFKKLLPGTEYKIKVTVDGFHKLDGEFQKTYYSPNRTNIVQLNAVTGSEDGSAIISFVIEGSDADQWIISYKSAGQSAQFVTFSGHTVTLNGLEIGTEYTATLAPSADLYLSGMQEVVFTASKRICAEDLAIVSCKDQKLTAVWKTPADTTVKEWSVLCYNDAGYRQNITTAQNIWTFDGIDVTQNYVVEVTAVGQSASQRTSIAENSITLDPMDVQVNANGQILLQWESSAPIPQGGWQISYAIEGTDFSGTAICQENTFVLVDTIPQQTYQISISAVEGAPVVCAPITVETPAADTFSCNFGGPTITADDLAPDMCKTPAKSNWNRKDLTKSSYTSTFKVGEKASFLLKAKRVYGISDDPLTALYVVYDTQGNIVCYSHEQFTWKTLWDYYYAELNLGSMPETVGDYTVIVYFNGDVAFRQTFTITE